MVTRMDILEWVWICTYWNGYGSDLLEWVCLLEMLVSVSVPELIGRQALTDHLHTT